MSHPPRPNQRPKYPPPSTHEEQLTMQQEANLQREIDEWAKREGTRHEQEEQQHREKETGDVRRNDAKDAGVREQRERGPGFGGQARVQYVMETHTREAELKRQKEERGRQGGAGVRYPWLANSPIPAQASTTRGDLSMENMIQIYQQHDRQWLTSLDRDELHWDHFPWPMFTQPGAPSDITGGAILAYLKSNYYPGGDSSGDLKDRIKDQMKKWHPDRLDKLLLKVVESQKESVELGAEAVVGHLYYLLGWTKSTSLPAPNAPSGPPGTPNLVRGGTNVKKFDEAAGKQTAGITEKKRGLERLQQEMKKIEGEAKTKEVLRNEEMAKELEAAMIELQDHVEESERLIEESEQLIRDKEERLKKREEALKRREEALKWGEEVLKRGEEGLKKEEKGARMRMAEVGRKELELVRRQENVDNRETKLNGREVELKRREEQIRNKEEIRKREDEMMIVMLLVRVILSNKSSYKRLLGVRGEEAQKILNCLQQLLCGSTLKDHTLRSHLLAATLRLCDTSGTYPVCLTLQGVQYEDKVVTAGQFGEIRRGRFQNKPVCLKVIKLYERSHIGRALKGFTREAIVWKQLNHPNLLPFYGIYQLDDRNGRVCLVSPWMENGNISEYLKVNPDIARRPLIRDIVFGLDHLHAGQIAHGDLKGPNIMITPAGSACLADFGLSSVADEDILRWTTLETSTRSGGTVRWMAPELFDENDKIVRPTLFSDVFALGSVMYEILTDQMPFHEFAQNHTVMFKIFSGEKPSKPPSSAWADLELTDGLWELMDLCWSFEPDKRPTLPDIIEKLKADPLNPVSRRRARHLPQKPNQDVNVQSFTSMGFQVTESHQGEVRFSESDIELLKGLID